MPSVKYSAIALLKAMLKVASFTSPTHLYGGWHVCSQLAADASAAATSISMDHQPTAGARIVINPGQVSAEAFYAGTVTGSGPYSVALLSSPGGSSAALANNHLDNEYVSYEPAWDLSNLNEPSTGDYARVEIDNWSTPADDGLETISSTNSDDVDFPILSADLPPVSHLFLADASTSGNKLALITPNTTSGIIPAPNGSELSFASGTLKLSITRTPN